MNDMQPAKTSNIEATIMDFITIRDLLKDSNQYFKKRIESKIETNAYEDIDHLKYLYEHSTNVLQLVNEMIKKSLKEPQKIKIETKTTLDDAESDETTSYLDMSMRKYESYELKNSSASPTTSSSNPNDYVDVMGKSAKDCNNDEDDDDDNIYDNYMVERNGNVVIATVKETVVITSQNSDVLIRKLDCPFNGLPAAHLTIMHSPKMGWLTMHLRRKRFYRHFGVHFKRKYYSGLVSKPCENENLCEWWLLMYAGGTSDLKPTVCLPLKQFEASADQSKNVEHSQNDCKRNPCKFELNEIDAIKLAKTYCFIAETPDHCDQWIHLLNQLSAGVPYVESSFAATAQIRKLPMPPLNGKHTDPERLTDTNDIDTVDTTKTNSEHVCNYSEGVYEEPEEYYKNVPITKLPRLPVKKTPSQSTASTIRMDDISNIYDTPKKSIRKTSEDYDQISVQQASTFTHSDGKTSELECSNRLKIDADIRKKLSTQLKEQSEKYSSGRRTSEDDETIKTNDAAIQNKYCQLSTMRKWLFTNHLAKLRQSTMPTNFKRKSSDNNSTTTENTTNLQSRTNQRTNKMNAIAPATLNETQKRAFSVQPKGNKVHMIINQLEANGQLTLLSGGGTSTNKCNTLMSA